MKDQETIQRFINLRAQGMAFAKIADELKVSKPTLIEWSRRYQFEIQNLRTVETEALAAQCLASRQHRWEQLGLHLRQVEEELAKRDLSEIPVSQLLSHAARLRAETGRELADLRFSIPTRNIPSDEYFEDVLDWQV